jgi:group I intron endonuclease
MNMLIYTIRNLVTGDIYVGQTSDRSRRFSRHRCSLRDGTHHNRFLQRSYRKYGAAAFVYEAVEKDLTEEQANAREAALIVDLRRDGRTVFNLREGGQNGSLREETKVRIGKANTGKKRSELTRRRISAAGRGRRQSPDTVAKRVSSRAGYRHDETTRASISQALVGRPKSSTHRESIRLARASLRKVPVEDDELVTQVRRLGTEEVARKYGVQKQNIYSRLARMRKRALGTLHS